MTMPSNTEKNFELSRRIRSMRRKKDITQKELAMMLGVKQATISKWEEGENEPNSSTIINLAKIFDCSTDCLLGLSNYGI